MNVGVLTFHWANNYGAVLQAYGLCKMIEGLGHNVRVINHVPSSNALPWWQGWGLNTGRPSMGLKRLRFDRFRDRYLPLTRECRTMPQLQSVAAEFDAVIVGSDQVWNGNIVKEDFLPYFLGFADDGRCSRISYAACFGEREQPAPTISAARRLLKHFDHISVRDEMSADLVRELSGREAEMVLDPSLLHHYREFSEPTIAKRDYIATYFISDAHSGIGKAVVSVVKEELRLPVVTIGANRKAVNGDRSIYSAGPLEWIQLLRGASFICTDSFHAAAFALKFSKPFISWRGLRCGRTQSLLNLCGQRDRLLDSPDPDVIRALTNKHIEYKTVQDVLAKNIARCRDFLQTALSPRNADRSLAAVNKGIGY